MVLIDATVLLLLLYPKVPAPLDPSTSKPVSEPQKRINHLVDQLQKSRIKIVVPTPALSEILVRAGDAAPSLVSKLQNSSHFKIASFDTRAAIEVSIMAREALGGGNKKKNTPASTTYAKLKYDWQIVAIGKTLGVTAIYSDDAHVKSLAARNSIPVIGTGDLPLPFEDPQQPLQY